MENIHGCVRNPCKLEIEYIRRRLVWKETTVFSKIREKETERKLGTKTPGVLGSWGGLPLGVVFLGFMEPDYHKPGAGYLLPAFAVTGLRSSISSPTSPHQVPCLAALDSSSPRCLCLCALFPQRCTSFRVPQSCYPPPTPFRHGPFSSAFPSTGPHHIWTP